MIQISQVSVSEEQERAVISVLRSGQLAMGQRTAELEESFSKLFGGIHCVAVASGTVGLTLAMAAAGVGPGTEVVTTAFSFIGTISPILQLGAVPVFVDVEPDTGNIDAMLVEAAVTDRTAAIVPVHLYGRPADMATLRSVARRRGLTIVEDACQAMGAQYGDGSMVGSSGIAVFSFYGSKNITCGEGGLVTTKDDDVAERVRLLRNHGSVEAYQHLAIGYNGRMTDMQAALLRPEVARVEMITSGRRQNAQTYTRTVNNPAIAKPPWSEEDGSCWHQYTVRTRSAEEQKQLQAWAKSRCVESRVYYPFPLSSVVAVERAGLHRACPVAERLARTVVSVPVRESLSEDEVSRVADMLNGWQPGS